MTQAAVGNPMAKGKSARNDKAVKIARDLAMKAKVIAETMNVSIAEYLSGLLRPHIEKDWPKALKRLDDPREDDS